jgi:hypothetical protein
MIAVTGPLIFLLSINPIGYAWHENLGIDANKAAELYQTKPNDPAIVQWKTALQLAINGMDKCFEIETAISCETLMATIISNCNSHPNELLACNDARIPQYPEVLKQAQVAQKTLNLQAKNVTIAYNKCYDTPSNGKFLTQQEVEKCESIIREYCDNPTYAQYMYNWLSRKC